LQQQQPSMGQMSEPINWLGDLQKRASASQGSSNHISNNFTLDRSNAGGNYHDSNSQMGGAANREDPLLAQLMNYNNRPLDGMPYHDPAIMSFTRQQQLQQQQQAQQSPSESYGSGFNPFESSQSTSSYRSGANFQQQPFSNQRTFT
jgi:hypothetical protein